jgi:hypothetical protein
VRFRCKLGGHVSVNMLCYGILCLVVLCLKYSMMRCLESLRALVSHVTLMLRGFRCKFDGHVSSTCCVGGHPQHSIMQW